LLLVVYPKSGHRIEQHSLHRQVRLFGFLLLTPLSSSADFLSLLLCCFSSLAAFLLLLKTSLHLNYSPRNWSQTSVTRRSSLRLLGLWHPWALTGSMLSSKMVSTTRARSSGWFLVLCSSLAYQVAPIRMRSGFTTRSKTTQ